MHTKIRVKKGIIDKRTDSRSGSSGFVVFRSLGFHKRGSVGAHRRDIVFYTFRICAVGSDNTQNISNPISSFVI